MVTNNQPPSSTPPVVSINNTHGTEDGVIQKDASDQSLPQEDALLKEENKDSEDHEEGTVSELVKDEAYFMSKYAEIDDLFQSAEYEQDYKEYKQHTETSEKAQLVATQEQLNGNQPDNQSDNDRKMNSTSRQASDKVTDETIDFDESMASSNRLNTVAILATLDEESEIVHAYGGGSDIRKSRQDAYNDRYHNTYQDEQSLNIALDTHDENDSLISPVLSEQESLTVNSESTFNNPSQQQDQILGESITINQEVVDTDFSDTDSDTETDTLWTADDALAAISAIDANDTKVASEAKAASNTTAESDTSQEVVDDAFNQTYSNIGAEAYIYGGDTEQSQKTLNASSELASANTLNPNTLNAKTLKTPKPQAKTNTTKKPRTKTQRNQDKTEQSIFDRMLYAIIGAIIFGFIGLVIDFVITIIRSLVGSGAEMMWLFAPLLLVIGFVMGVFSNRDDDSISNQQADASVSNEVVRGVTIALLLSLTVWIGLLFFT